MGAEARNSYNFWQSHESERLAKRKFQAKEKCKRPSVLKGFPNLPGHGVCGGGVLSQETLHRYFQFKKKGKWAHPVSLTVDYLCLFLHGANSSQMTIHLQAINKGQRGFRLFLWLKVAKKKIPTILQRMYSCLYCSFSG